MADNDQRQKREFVPPPWERDQFEELARRKAEQDIDRLVETIGAPEPESEPDAPEAELAAVVDGGGAPAGEVKTAPGNGELPLSEAELEVMLYGLKAQEPDAVQHLWIVSLTVAVVIAVGGALILGYGLFALSKSMRAGAGAAVGAGTVIGVGGLFIAAGAWLAVKGLRQRGER